MYFTWKSTCEAIAKENDPTPESLREAIKVLEAKAEELEKPKLNPQQEAAIAAARAHYADMYRRTDDGSWQQVEVYGHEDEGKDCIFDSEHFVRSATWIEFWKDRNGVLQQVTMAVRRYEGDVASEVVVMYPKS